MSTLACDLGGTRIKLGMVDEGRILASMVLPAHSDQPLVGQLPLLAERLRGLCLDANVPLAECEGIGVSFPSLIDVRTARILADFGKHPGAMDLDLRAWAWDEFGLPLAIDNDARMAAIGEWRYGAGRDCDDLVMVTLGTGIGTSVVMEGRVLRGRHGQAGCLGGHLTARYDGRACACGNVGCAEAEASTVVIAALAHTRADFAQSPLSQEEKVDYAAVFRYAAQGDSCALALRDHSLRVWAANTVSLIHAYDPERIVLGGGIMASREIIVPAIQTYVDSHAMTPWGRVRVAASERGDDAALVACEWLVREQQREGWTA